MLAVSNGERVIVGGSARCIHVLDVETGRICTMASPGQVTSLLPLANNCVAYVWERLGQNSPDIWRICIAR
jgi:hypothetical protein